MFEVDEDISGEFVASVMELANHLNVLLWDEVREVVGDGGKDDMRLLRGLEQVSVSVKDPDEFGAFALLIEGVFDGEYVANEVVVCELDVDGVIHERIPAFLSNELLSEI